MATATKNLQTREVTTTVTENVVILTLSEDEARALSDLLGAVGGNSEKSRREHSEAIERALRGAGFETLPPYEKSDMSGSIYFADIK